MRISRVGVVTAIAALIVSVASCGGDGATAPKAPVVSSVLVSPGAETIVAIGGTTQLSATPRDATGGTVGGQTVVWSSSSGAVATVSSTGLVTAVANGSATVTATVGTISGTATVTVQQSVATIVVSPDTATVVSIGDTVRYMAVARDPLGVLVAGAPIVWSSTNTAVASVNSTGLVTAAANGAASIRATVGAVTGTALASVIQLVATVVVTPGTADVVAVGQTAQYSAAATDANSVAVAGAQYLWISSNHNVAVVNGSGLVTATGAGSVTITAAVQGVPGVAVFNVAPAVATVVITTGDIGFSSLFLTRQLAAEARDANGVRIPGAAITWGSSNAFATVDGQGLVTSVSNGAATITATSGGVSGNVTATVAQLVSAGRSQVSVSPGNDVPADGFSESEITVTLSDANGYPVAGRTVQLSVTAAPVLTGASLTQPSAATNSSGVARGSIISTSFGLKQITATADPTGASVVVVQKPTVSFGATRIGWSTQPTNRTSGQRMNNMAVSFFDADGNVVTTATRAVTVSFAANPNTANLYGTVSRAPVNGVVTYSDVAVDFPGSGYTFTATPNGFTRLAATTSAPFNMAAVSVTTASTIAATVSNCDDCAETVFLGFDFAFNWFGIPFQNMAISSNGFAAFSGTAITAFSNTSIPNAATPNGVVAGLWDDLHTGTAGDIYWQVAGAAPNRRAIVEYRGVSWFGGGGTVNFNIILNETSNRVEFIYGALSSVTPGRASGGLATIGVESTNGTAGLQIGFNQANRVFPGTRIILDWNGTNNYVRTFLP